MHSTDQIRVLHLIGGKSFQGGTASVVRDLVEASSNDISNLIWVHRHCPDDDLPFLREGSVEHVNRSISRDLYAAIVDLPRLLRTVREKNVDILHAHTRAGIFAGWLVRRFSRVPMLVHLHFLARHTWLYRFLIKTADAFVIYNSHRTARHFGADLKTATIINPTIQWPSEVPRESSEPRIVAASALLPHKHLDVVVDSCTLLANKGTIVETRIYGKTLNCQGGGYERGVIQACSDKSFIILDEWSRDWARNLCTSDIFVHLGEPESFGLVILEAFARGLRLVVLPNTFLNGLEGVVSSTGIYRAAQLNPHDVADAIQKALADSAACDSLRSLRAELESEFSTRRASEQVAEIYRQFISSSVLKR